MLSLSLFVYEHEGKIWGHFILKPLIWYVCAVCVINFISFRAFSISPISRISQSNMYKYSTVRYSTCIYTTIRRFPLSKSTLVV